MEEMVASRMSKGGLRCSGTCCWLRRVSRTGGSGLKADVADKRREKRAAWPRRALGWWKEGSMVVVVEWMEKHYTLMFTCSS